MKPIFSVCCLILVGGLTACSESTKESLGLARRTPDAFSVVTRAPLDIPPDYYLRPPTPGAPRPQEQTPDAQAANALIGGKPVAKSASKIESAVLQQANVGAADPNIRSTIDAETIEIIQSEQPTINKIIGKGGDLSTAPAPVIDPKQELERLKSETKK